MEVPSSEAQDDLHIPREVTVQIIHDPSMLAAAGGQLVTSLGSAVFSTDEPGMVAQTLLNIGQGDIDKKILEVDQSLEQLGSGDGEGSLACNEEEAKMMLIKQEQEENNTFVDMDEKQKVAEDIRIQMRELCNQLADVGEECYLVSVREEDGNIEHLGSIKGDHYCLLRQEMLHDFKDFCLGIESRDKPDDDAEDDEVDICNLDEDDNIKQGTPEIEEEEEDNEEEKMETDSPEVEEVTARPNSAIVPKVIVLKKDSEGKKVSVDHQYTAQGNKHKSTTIKVGPPLKTVSSTEEKENRTTTNILFLCDICKDVFMDIKDLRDHKLKIHDEGDYKCTKCPRIFTLKKTLDRHLIDAHNPDGEDDRFLCDSCVVDFRNKTELEKHIAAVHDSELPMKCDVCEQTFTDIHKMMDHRKVHFDYDCFCNKCWQGFFDYLELETHIQTNCRYKEALYKCDICGKRYTKLAAINKHIDTHPIHSPHVCRMCGRGFETEKDLKYHRTAAHIIRPFKCEFCDKTFKKKDSVIEHRRIHLRIKKVYIGDFIPNNGRSSKELVEEEETESILENEFECHICGIVLSSQSNLDQHLHQHETATEHHRCDRCNKVFFSHGLLTVHCRKEHKIFLNNREDISLDNELLACEWEGCNKTFYDRTKWKYHMKYHEQRADRAARGMSLTPKPESTPCKICGKVLKYKSYMKAHLMTHSSEQPHQCDICGQAYTNSKRLADHIRVHKGEKPFKCRVCDKAFTSTSLRNQHMVIHWGHKTYICDVCGKGFMSRKHFHDHMRIHNGEQPHKCETCGKDFIYYRSLVRHSLTHIDPKERPKPYKCQYCGKEYTEVTGYKHHLRSVHTGETPFQCDICGDAFHRNDKLKRHMKSRHGKGEQKSMMPGLTHIVTTRRTAGQSAPIIVKTETEQRNPEDLMQIDNVVGAHPNELHVDVIQDAGPQQVFLIGLGHEGGETTYLQETQVIEGPDGVRYIIAGSGEELQVIESGNVQHVEGDIIEGDIIQQIQQVEQIQNSGENIMVMNDGSLTGDQQETLNTLANMASVAEVADIVQNVE